MLEIFLNNLYLNEHSNYGNWYPRRIQRSVNNCLVILWNQWFYLRSESYAALPNFDVWLKNIKNLNIILVNVEARIGSAVKKTLNFLVI